MINRIIVLFALALVGCGDDAASVSAVTTTTKGDTGATGAAGATGATGATGQTGPSGSGFSISSGFDCSLSSGGWVFTYQAVTYSTGDVFVIVSTTDGYRTSSSSKLYKSTQAGAVNKSLTLVSDTGSPYNFGYWRFNTDTLRSATYVESGSANDGQFVTFIDSDCTIY